MLTGAWIAGFTLAIYLLGILIAVPLFVYSYMKAHGTRWHIAIISSIVLVAIIYLGFDLGLGRELYAGLLFTWLGS